MRNVMILVIALCGLSAQSFAADNPYQQSNNSSHFHIATCGQVTSVTDNTGIMSDGMNLNFVVALTAVNYLKANIPASLLMPYLGPNATPADRLGFYQSVLSYLQNYCQAHPFASFDKAEQALAQELSDDHG